MFVIEPVRKRHVPLVEPVVACLVATDQQNCRAPRIKGLKNANGIPAALNAKFPHVIVSRTLFPRALGIRQSRSVLLQQFDQRGNVLPFAHRKRFPPVRKRVRVLDAPTHDPEYSVDGMRSS